MTPTFHWADYLLFGLSLALSSAIGIYHGVKERNKHSADDFLMAGRNMSVFPVVMSLIVSYISAISLIGDPTEAYYYGAVYWLVGLGYMAALPVVAEVFAPVYHKIKNISAYGFMKQVYGVHMRTFLSVAYGINLGLYLGIALYAPCVALSQMTGLNLSVCIVVIGGICTFYTSLGGLKAVLWADTVQGFVMLAGLLACLIQGVISVGGPQRVIDIAREGNRLDFKIDPNPLLRATVWSNLIGGFFRIFNTWISSQMFIQRYCTLNTERKMKLAIYLSMPVFGLFVSLFAMIGLTMYAYFKDCDPLMQGRIQKADQILPLMVMETLGHLPGIPGVFLACICSAALSSLSSCQSTLAATCLEDIVQPLYRKYKRKEFTPKTAKYIAVILSVIFGLLTIGLAFLVLQLQNTTLYSLTTRVVGTVDGAIAGIFVLAVLFPFVNQVSVVVGSLLSVCFLNWLVIGGIINPPPLVRDLRLAVSTNGCLDDTLWGNETSFTNHTSYTVLGSTTPEYSGPPDRTSVEKLYELNPLYFAVVGNLITVIVGLILGGLYKLYVGRKNAKKTGSPPLEADEKIDLTNFEQH